MCLSQDLFFLRAQRVGHCWRGTFNHIFLGTQSAESEEVLSLGHRDPGSTDRLALVSVTAYANSSSYTCHFILACSVGKKTEPEMHPRGFRTKIQHIVNCGC